MGRNIQDSINTPADTIWRQTTNNVERRAENNNETTKILILKLQPLQEVNESSLHYFTGR